MKVLVIPVGGLIGDINYVCIPFNRIEDVSCESYEPPTDSVCGRYLPAHNSSTVKYAVRPSDSISHHEISAQQFVSTILTHIIVHNHCLDALQPFVCRWVFFPTCDPACNVSRQQRVCRRACEILTTFLCPEAWKTYTEIMNILDLPRRGNSSTCDNLLYANGSDVPDCIDPWDAGEYIKHLV